MFGKLAFKAGQQTKIYQSLVVNLLVHYTKEVAYWWIKVWQISLIHQIRQMKSCQSFVAYGGNIVIV